MKKVLLFISMLLAAVLITGLYSCTQDGGDNDNRHRQGQQEESLEEIGQNVERVTKVAGEVLLQCKSPADAKDILDEIRTLDAVEKVWADNQAVFVKIRNFGTIPYIFPLKDKNLNPDGFKTEVKQVTQSRAKELESDLHSHIDLKKVCIVNQQYKDENREFVNGIVGYTNYILDKANFKDIKINNSPSIDFFRNDIFGYDIIFVITHGVYDDGQHWLLTSDEHWNSISGWVSNSWLKFWNDYSADEISIGSVKEKRDGKEEWVYYTMVSETFIANSDKSFTHYGNAILFLTACESLMGEDGVDYSMADKLISKGLGCYLGYDESNELGKYGGLLFLGRLASGMSIEQAYLTLPPVIVNDECEEKDDNGNVTRQWTAHLECYSDGFDQNTCITHPLLNESGMDLSGDNGKRTLKATQYLYDPNIAGSFLDKLMNEFYYNINSSPFRYGFYLSETKDVKDAYILNKLKVGDPGSEYDGEIVSFEADLNNEDLKPETTYYFWAFFFDGKNYCLSDRGEFTTPKQERIEQVIPKEILETMEPYITIYEGDSPPVVEGVYVISPNVISYDSTNGFDAGDLFADHYLKFSNQDILKNTLDFEGKEVVDGRTISYEGGPGAFISGTGDNFTVFFDVSGTAYFDEYNVDYTEALVISGTLTSTGIKNAEYSFVLTWKGDDPKPYAIKMGDFRVFKDSDGLASKASWPSGARSWGWNYHVKDGKVTTPWSIYAVKK